MVSGQILQKSVAEKQTNSLRLLVVVGGHGAFVAAFRDRSQIALAHLNRQSPKSTSLTLAQRPHSLGRCRQGGSPSGQMPVQSPSAILHAASGPITPP